MTKEQLREVERDLVKTGLENIQNIVLIKNGATNGDVIKGLYLDTEVDDLEILVKMRLLIFME